jgi:predicted phosphodiesterase
MSDLHNTGDTFKYTPVGEDVLVLAGDIHNASVFKNFPDNIPSDMQTIFVAGNHEYYDSDIESINAMYDELSETHDNFHFLNNTSIDIGGYSFFGGTMWSDFNLYHNKEISKMHARTGINDFRYIRTADDKKLTPDCVESMFNDWKVEFEKWNKSTNKLKISVSHFVPSIRSISKIFNGNILNPYFTSDCDSMLESVSLWIHGHTHTAFDYSVGNCRVVCNPRGYSGERSGFNENLIVSI